MVANIVSTLRAKVLLEVGAVICVSLVSAADVCTTEVSIDNTMDALKSPDTSRLLTDSFACIIHRLFLFAIPAGYIVSHTIAMVSYIMSPVNVKIKSFPQIFTRIFP